MPFRRSSYPWHASPGPWLWRMVMKEAPPWNTRESIWNRPAGMSEENTPNLVFTKDGGCTTVLRFYRVAIMSKLSVQCVPAWESRQDSIDGRSEGYIVKIMRFWERKREKQKRYRGAGLARQAIMRLWEWWPVSSFAFSSRESVLLFPTSNTKFLSRIKVSWITLVESEINFLNAVDWG